MITRVLPRMRTSLHFKCSQVSNRWETCPCVRVYDISNSKISLELSPEVLALNRGTTV